MSFGKTDPKRAKVNDPNGTYERQAPTIELVRDIAAGWTRIQARGTTYLPRHAAEELEDWRIRASRPVFLNLFGRTIAGLTGLVFRRDPLLSSDVPQEIVDHWENIDLRGNHGAVFLRQVFEDALTVGHGAILVDAPPVDGELSVAEERELGVRPYWTYIRAEQILSWRSALTPVGIVATQVVIHEPREVPVGDFGAQVVNFYRVLRLTSEGVTWQLWQEGESRDDLKTVGLGVIANVDQIPIAPVYAKPLGGLFQSKPPLLDLATLNLHHYQLSSDIAHSAHVANVPILVTKMGPEGLKISPNAAVDLTDANASVEWVETSGSAIGMTREMLKDVESAAAVLGLETLKREARIPETAEARRLDRIEQDSTLAATARSLQDAAELAMQFHAQMLDLPDGGSLKLLTDFHRLTLGSDEIRSYSEMVRNNQLSIETLFDVLVEGGAAPSTFDPKVEMARLTNRPAEERPTSETEDDEDGEDQTAADS